MFPESPARMLTAMEGQNTIPSSNSKDRDNLLWSSIAFAPAIEDRCRMEMNVSPSCTFLAQTKKFRNYFLRLFEKAHL